MAGAIALHLFPPCSHSLPRRYFHFFLLTDLKLVEKCNIMGQGWGGEGRRKKAERKKNTKEGKESGEIWARHPHWKALAFLGTSTDRRLIGYSFLFSSNNRRELCQKCSGFQRTITFQKQISQPQTNSTKHSIIFYEYTGAVPSAFHTQCVNLSVHCQCVWKFCYFCGILESCLSIYLPRAIYFPNLPYGQSGRWRKS